MKAGTSGYYPSLKNLRLEWLSDGVSDWAEVSVNCDEISA
jgi:hypothetical protein